MKASVRFWAGWGIALALAWAAVVWVVLQWNLSNYTQLVADPLVLLVLLIFCDRWCSHNIEWSIDIITDIVNPPNTNCILYYLFINNNQKGK